MTVKTKTRRTLAAVSVVALGMAGVALSAMSASAAPVDGPINPDTKGSITIHKYENPGDGSQNPSGTGTNPTKPIQGVTFQVCKIDNITSLADGTNTGWNQVKNLNALSGSPLTGAVTGLNGSTAFPLSNCTTKTTDASGLTGTWSGLSVGAYLVKETAAPSGVVKGDPFIVTVPTPADNLAGGTNSGKWEYDVQVFPKNSKSTEPVKSTDNQVANGVLIGDEIGYNIKQIIPALNLGEKYQYVTITDALDTRLDLKSGTVVVKLNGVVLPVANYTLTSNIHLVKVELNSAFLTAGGIKAGDELTVEFTAIANATGKIPNTALVNINHIDWFGKGKENPTNPVEERYGKIIGEKVNSNGTTKLAGAEFQVYYTTDTDGTCTNDAATFGLKSATPLKKNGVTLIVTSDSSGRIDVGGLWVGDSNDLAVNRCYILEEVKAPAGYVLPTGNAALHAVNVNADTVTTTPTFQIKNDQQLVPGLPLTGSDGQKILMASGGALVLLAMGGVLVARKRRATAEV